MSQMRDAFAAVGGAWKRCEKCKLRFVISAEQLSALRAKGHSAPNRCQPCLDIPKHKAARPEDWITT